MLSRTEYDVMYRTLIDNGCAPDEAAHLIYDYAAEEAIRHGEYQNPRFVEQMHRNYEAQRFSNYHSQNYLGSFGQMYSSLLGL